MKFLVLTLVFLVSMGCTSSHKSEHGHSHDDRNPAHSGEEDHHHYHEANLGLNPYQLPEDELPLFCDLNRNGTMDDEIAEGKVCEIDGGNTIFASKPILAMGLKKGELILTIDDGPTSGVTDDILSLLDRYGIKAGFFLTGSRVARNDRLVRRMYEEGHTIGNHTYSHNVKTITSKTIAGEIIKAQEVIDKALGEQQEGRLLFRAPGLAWNKLKATNLNANSRTRRFIGPIHANLGTDAPAADWHCWSKSGGRKSAQKCADLYFDTIMKYKRGVVLAHDLNRKTYDMLSILLDRLDRNGGIRRSVNKRGGWVFRDLQKLTFLEKYEEGGSQSDASIPIGKTESPFKKTNYRVRHPDLIEKNYDQSVIPYNYGSLLTGNIAKYKDLGKTYKHEPNGVTFRLIKIDEMIDGLPTPSTTVVYVGDAAFYK